MDSNVKIGLWQAVEYCIVVNAMLLDKLVKNTV